MTRNLDLLAQANAAADRLSGASGGLCCPAKTETIEVLVIAADDSPVLGVGVTLRRGDGELRDETTSDGLARFTGLSSGEHELSLPRLDRDVWQIVRRERLPPESIERGLAAWTELSSELESAGGRHEVQPGEGLSSIAYLYGHLPETLAEHPENAALRAQRQNLEALVPGDVLFVPPGRLGVEAVETGFRYTIRRRDVPSKITVRFLDWKGVPCAGVPYLLEIISSREGDLPIREGETDGDGAIVAAVPPDAGKLIVTLKIDGELRQHEILVGYLSPLDTIAGLQTRLRNLGLYGGDITGALDEATIEAMQRLQTAHQIPLTESPDDATRALLGRLHRG